MKIRTSLIMASDSKIHSVSWTLFVLLCFIPLTAAAHNTTMKVRLRDGTNATNGDYVSGRLEVSLDGVSWGTVCDDFFNKSSAIIICRNFGYIDGESVSRGHFGSESDLPIFLDNVECTGVEKSLDECSQSQWGVNDCKHTEDVGLYCFNDSSKVFSTRLVNGVTDNIEMSGRVEVRLGNMTWGSVCDDIFTDLSARVVCRNFKYLYGERFTRAHFGEGNQTYLDQVHCRGNEKSLLECPHDSWKQHDCGNEEDVGVSCFNVSVKIGEDRKFKQQGGSVSVWNTTFRWMEVCDEGWDDVDAKVACKDLGYVDGKALCCSALTHSPFLIFTKTSSVKNVTCTGNEKSFADCGMTIAEEERCRSRRRASAICYNDTINNVNMTFDVRMVNGGNNWGEVEVRHLGMWAPICMSSDEWTDKQANVVCRMRGFTGGKAMGNRKRTEEPGWLRDVTCNGTEKNLTDCGHDEWGRSTLFCYRVLVLCYMQEISVNFTDPSKMYGRVQINYDGQVGSICSVNLTETEATTVCRDLGYQSGQIKVLPAGEDQGTGGVYFSGLKCRSSHQSLFECTSRGWNVSVDGCSSHQNDLAVRCFKDVRLVHGTEETGVVEIYEDDSWVTICGSEGFTDREGGVVCRQLGYSYGKVLPLKVFGRVDGPHYRPLINCENNETSILDCSYDISQPFCLPSGLSYASVSCYDNQATAGEKYSLFNSDPTQDQGILRIRDYHTIGYACNELWDDEDADVLCRQLGNAGGISNTFISDISGPFFINDINCTGTENHIDNCTQENEVCYYKKVAGVLCYKKTAPTLRLQTIGHASRGRLEIVRDDEVGSICGNTFDDNDASVACTNLGYNGGRPLQFPATRNPVVLADLQCNGNENSLFRCSNSGWKMIMSPSCKGAEVKDAGVACFKYVRITGGNITETRAEGILSIYTTQGWREVCDNIMDMKIASVACREMGYDEAVIMSSTDTYSASNIIGSLKCNGNETTISQCSYSFGYCYYPNERARIMCFKNQGTVANTYHIENGYNGRVFVERHGVNGTICEEDWNQTNADILCKTKGFAGGVVLGTKSSRNYQVTWYATVKCSGNETNFDDCEKWRNVSGKCVNARNSAGVLCYRTTGLSYRLANGSSNNFGRVEIQYDGVWGTVCDYGWSQYDAKALCSQLGFVDGIAYARSRYGRGSGPVYLDEMRCRYSEKSLLNCPNNGWNVSSSYCKDHNNDASVYCRTRVRISTGESYGPLEYYLYSYNRICDDGFDDKSATVACRELGYVTGKALCCSAFGDSDRIRVGEVKCDGTESSLEHCPKRLSYGQCSQGKYVSVVCSKSTDTEAYTVKLEAGDHGRINVTHMDHTGYICSNLFTKHDADVVCREAGYYGGIPLKFTNYRSSRIIKDIRWVGNMGCKGDEQTLKQCPRFKWGGISDCTTSHDAGAVCFDNAEDAIIKYQLVNGTHTEGRIEIKVKGTWGSVCGIGLSDLTAHVLCLELGFKGGVSLIDNTYGPSNGPVHINRMRCTENSTTLTDCVISGFDEPDKTCDTHLYDAAIRCFSDVRAVGSFDDKKDYGRVEIRNGSSWLSVCDTGFDDVAAGIVCRQLGFVDGKTQCCSSLGRIYPVSQISISSISCQGTEKEIKQCSINFGNCSSNQYASIFCMSSAMTPSLSVQNLPTVYAGAVNVSRYGIIGAVCADGFGRNEAQTVCKNLRFVNGFPLKPNRLDAGSPIVMGNVSCSSTTQRLDQCTFNKFGEDQGCFKTREVAQVLCTDFTDDIQYRVRGTSRYVGRAEIYLNRRWGTIANMFFTDTSANVFCKSAGFVGGEMIPPLTTNNTDTLVIVSGVRCRGTEKSLLDCEANWDSTFNRGIPRSNSVYVRCFKSAKIVRGDAKTNGILNVYKNTVWGTVCAEEFEDVDARVACRELGFEDGKALCCSPYGFSLQNVLVGSLNCTGKETSLADCGSVTRISGSICLRQNYASVACFNGATPIDYNVTLDGDANYTGSVVVNYNGVSGRICADDWDDNDAKVVCKELGFPKGQAYNHYRSAFEFFSYSGPYWTSDVNCTGSENNLGQCKHIGFGNVEQCKTTHFAGVLCYDKNEIFYRIVDGESNYGRVEVSVNGNWGTVCDRFFDRREAAVLCKTLGFTDGDVDFSMTTSKETGPVWESNMRCVGTEDNLNACPHEGWQSAKTSSCVDHSRDVHVFCYSSVKLTTGVGKNENNGPVLVYEAGKWARVCDDDFTDKSARVVCRELGFVEGRAISGAAYGSFFLSSRVLSNQTIQCRGDEQSVSACLKKSTCNSGLYASVVCFSNDTFLNDTAYTVEIEEQEKTGRVEITHYGIKGRICSKNWTDNEAKVVCKKQGYKDGIAYQHSVDSTYVPELTLGPFWLSNVSCSGEETSLLQCSHNDRLNIGNCTDGHTAAVLCFDDSGIEYRMVGGSDHYGRVEIGVRDVWGTVCDRNWDEKDARVFCKQKGFHDGVALGEAEYGEGTGPVWLSHLQCTGTESALHQCPHRGFNGEVSTGSDFWPYPRACSTHKDDASVFCYKNVRLNTKFKQAMGALEVYYNNRWTAVCDTGINNIAATVACKSLGLNYTHGRVLPGSPFGNLSESTDGIKISGISCSATLDDITKCTITEGQCGQKGYYAGIACSETPFNLTAELEINLAADGLSGESHGIIEVRKQGLWGRVCLQGWDDRDANVACRELGFKGGVSYLHIVKNNKVMLMRNVSCSGSETELKQCFYDTSPDLESCGYNSNDGGVICYNETEIIYRLNGGKDKSTGRVEIQYEGSWGSVCSWAWNSNNAKVLCRHLGYQDGVPRYQTIPNLPEAKPLLNGVFCNGNESSLFTCLNSGFKSSLLSYLCVGDAYTTCYNTAISVTDIRLAGGDNSTGRVEVFVKGPNEWGTVCDDYWDDTDATIVCKQLGWDGGVIYEGREYVAKEGPIWLDNVDCTGNETKLSQCEHRGIGTNNCNHTEDAAVKCFRKQSTIPPSSTPVPTTKIVMTTPRKTTPMPTKQPETDRPSQTNPTSTSTTEIPVVAPPGARGSKSATPMAAIIVPIVLVIVIVAVIAAIVVYRLKFHGKRSVPHERFSDDIIEHTHDGSIAMNNQMFDSLSDPVDPLGDSSAYMAEEVTIGENGSAHFAKPNGNGPTDNGFSNPLYNVNTEEIMSNPAKIDVQGAEDTHTTT